MKWTDNDSLKAWMQHPLHDLNSYLRTAILLTEMVDKVHQKNEIIGVMSPADILIQMDELSAHIVENVHANDIYKSPEQTGRLNRTPDQRSDLYILGVIFYEMLTGQLPFETKGSSDWNYIHISELPRPMSDISPEVEGTLQSMVMKLLAKSPDDRYQSTYSLLYDLKKYQLMIQGDGSRVLFKVGEIDKASQFDIQDTFFGRSAEMDQLQRGFEKACSGGFVAVYVTGSDGLGKTSLIQQFKQSVLEQGGLFIQGKCDQISNQHPEAESIIQALREWIEQLWSEPASIIAIVKERLTQLQLEQSERRLLLEIVPEISTLLGTSVNSLDSTSMNLIQTQPVLSKLLLSLLQCFVDAPQSVQPLVLFLDDLQYADDETLVFLEQLLQHGSLPGLMLIGAQQESLDSASHHEIESIQLHALYYDDVRKWLSSVLHDDTNHIRLLARALYDQTEGNPRAIRQLLKNWYKEKKLYYDQKQHRWMWDAEIKGQMSEASESLHLYRKGLDRLSEGTRHMLAIAAVIGPSFLPSILAEVCGNSLTDTLDLLRSAEAEGIICYQDEDSISLEKMNETPYMFMHIGMQQMLFKSAGKDRSKWHLLIGRALQLASSEWPNDGMYAAIDQLNLGVNAMTDQEKLELVEFNFQAGSRAYDAKNLTEAKKYFDCGLELVATKEHDPDSVICRVILKLAICEHIAGNKEQAKILLTQLMNQRDKLNKMDRNLLYVYQIEVYTFDDTKFAVQIGREALSEFGWNVPEKVSKGMILREVMQTQVFLYKIRNKMHLLPIEDDAEDLVISRLIMGLSVALLIHNPEVYIVLCARFIRYNLKRGINESLMTILVMYETFLQRGVPWLNRTFPTKTHEYLEMTSFANVENNDILPLMIGLFKQLEQPLETTRYLEKVLRKTLESDNITFANLVIFTCLVTYNNHLHALHELLILIESKTMDIMDENTLSLYHSAKAYTEALQDEAVQEKYISVDEAEHRGQEENYTCINKLEVAYLTGRYSEALYWAKRGRKQELELDWLQNRKLRVYEALSYAASYEGANSEEQHYTKQVFKKMSHKMNKWIGHWGQNSSAHLLIQAEWNRINTNKSDVRQMYEAAIKKAQEEQQGLMEAMACERLADYYTKNGSPNGVAIALMDACMAYSVWGVSTKVNQIKHKYPDLWWYASKEQEKSSYAMEEIEHYEQASRLEIAAVSDVPYHFEDQWLEQMVKWPSEQNSNLLEQFLVAVTRQLGADRGYVISSNGESFHIEAQMREGVMATNTSLYSEYIVRHVAFTRDIVMLDNAIHSYYVKDPYVAHSAPCSILCVPIQFPRNEVSLLLYLENTRVTGVFTQRNLSVLELMITRLTYLYLQESFSIHDLQVVQPAEQSQDVESLVEPLTNRETEVLAALTKGLSNKEIAVSLGITEATVKTHIVNIYSKLGVKRRAQAIVRAKELQLISD